VDQKTIDTYNKIAIEYEEETDDFWQRFPSKIIPEFIRKVRKNEFRHKNGQRRMILDIGSGPGRDGLIFENSGCPVVCLDASRVMIKMCRQRGLQAITRDFMKIPFNNKSFAGVWAYTSLLHIHKKLMPKVLQEIYRVLKDDGIFGLGLIEGTEEIYTNNMMGDAPRFFAYYKKRELEEILFDAGFEILYFEAFRPSSRRYLNFVMRKI